MQDFKNKVVVIPGGATGIGFGFAKAFGKEEEHILLLQPGVKNAYGMLS